MEWSEDIDTLGLLCPLPVLKARKRLKSMEPGQVLCLRADDPAAAIDVPHFCAEAGHILKEVRNGAQGQIYLIEKGRP